MCCKNFSVIQLRLGFGSGEVLLERIPALVVGFVNGLSALPFDCPECGAHRERRLEHEGERVLCDALRPQLRLRGRLEALAVRPVRDHHAMQPAGEASISYSYINTLDTVLLFKYSRN